jgi:hypothetical protein
MRVFAGGSGVMRGGKSDKSSKSGVLGVFEPDRLLAIVSEVELSGGSSSMVMDCDVIFQYSVVVEEVEVVRCVCLCIISVLVAL